MRRHAIAMILVTLLGETPALAQVGAMGAPTPGIGVTSPLGMTPNSTTSPAGIPLGATELASPGISPAVPGTLGMSGGATGCGTLAGSSPGMSSAGSTYDGGGMAIGSGSSLTGSTSMPGTSMPGTSSMSGMCGGGASSSAPSATSTLTPSPGGASKAGIPLDSVEIGNAGISPMVTVPAPSSYPSMMGNYPTTGSGTPCSMMGSSSPSPSMSSTGC
jgi:hypothetical protein